MTGVYAVFQIFANTVFGSLLRRARQFGAVRRAQAGAVTFIQRSGGSLNLNVHFQRIQATRNKNASRTR